MRYFTLKRGEPYLDAINGVHVISWQDKSALESNKQLMATLKDEQHAQRLGRTTGRVQNTSNVGRKLPAEMLDWLASADGSSSRRKHSLDVTYSVDQWHYSC